MSEDKRKDVKQELLEVGAGSFVIEETGTGEIVVTLTDESDAVYIKLKFY